MIAGIACIYTYYYRLNSLYTKKLQNKLYFEARKTPKFQNASNKENESIVFSLVGEMAVRQGSLGGNGWSRRKFWKSRGNFFCVLVLSEALKHLCFQIFPGGSPPSTLPEHHRWHKRHLTRKAKFCLGGNFKNDSIETLLGDDL